MPKDIVKQELAIDDTVVFNPPYQKGLVVGIITKMTDKTVSVKWETHRFEGGVYYRTGRRSVAEVMKVDPQYAVLYHLTHAK